MINFPLEPDVRIQVDERLKNLGWTFSGSKKNVFLEQPKTPDQKSKLKGRRPDYVLYEKGKDNPLIIIETKRNGSDILSALEQGRDYAEILEAPIVFATDGVYYKSLHTKTKKPLILNGEEVDELIREILAIQYLQVDSYALDTIPKEVQLSRQELIGIFDEANNTLRVEGLRAGIERFSEFANILFLKLFSEIDNLRDKPEVDRKYKWDFYKGKPSDEILDYINNIVLRKINEFYKDDNIFIPLQIKDGRVLKKIVDKIDPLVLTDINSDIKGDAFEYFLKATSATGNDLGEYFTPRHIVKMMVKLVNPQITERIYDPFCGTGGLLIESFRHIYNTMPRNDRNMELLRKHTIFGNEITSTARITKMNMILAGDGHSNIRQKNSLQEISDIENKFDVVVTNMPYSQTTDFGSIYDIPSKNGDSICVQHCIKAINKTSENGRIAVIVPEGFLFRKDLRKTREYLLNRCNLQSIISLPQGVFLPYTGVKTNVLFLTKVNQPHIQKDIWYFEIKNDGLSLDNNRRKLDGENDIERFLANRKVENKSQALNVGFDILDIDKVKSNDYILSGNRYKELKELQTSQFDIVSLSSVAEVIAGQSPEGQFYNDKSEGLPFYQGKSDFGEVYLNEPTKWTSQFTKIAIKNDILMSVRAPVGPVNISPFDICIGRGLAAIRPSSKINYFFLFYLLKNIQNQIKLFATGSTFEAINKKTIEELKIPLPPLDAQNSIVQELLVYQKLIDGAKLIVENYQYFVQPEKSWPIVNLEEICKYSGGTQPPKSTFIYNPKEGYIRLLQIRDFKSDENAVYIPIEEKHKTCSEDDVMIGRYGPPVFQILRGKKGAYNVALIKCIPDKKRLSTDWLFYFLNSESIQKHIIGLSERSRQSGVSPSDLNKLKIPLPSLSVQREVINKIKEEELLVTSNKKLIEIFSFKISDKINQVLGI